MVIRQRSWGSCAPWTAFSGWSGPPADAPRLLAGCSSRSFWKDAYLSAEDLTAEVRRRAPDAHVSTVYRNLEELERLDVISRTHLGRGPITYQLAARAHPHLICQRCGTRVHVPESLFVGFVRTARKSLVFEIDPGYLSVAGSCADCS